MADLKHTPGTLPGMSGGNPAQERQIMAGGHLLQYAHGRGAWPSSTRTPALREQQRLQVELLLADHNEDCAVCIRHGNCELQDVAQFVGLQQSRYHYPHFYEQRTPRRLLGGHYTRHEQMYSLPALRQGVPRDSGHRRPGDHRTRPWPRRSACATTCPWAIRTASPAVSAFWSARVGALAERDNTETVIDHLYDPQTVTVFQFAPAIRVCSGRVFRHAGGQQRGRPDRHGSQKPGRRRGAGQPTSPPIW